MHTYLEGYSKIITDILTTALGQEAGRMATWLFGSGLGDLEEVWGTEVTYTTLGCMQVERCSGVYNGRESIIDFKQTNKAETTRMDEDYFIQLAAYAWPTTMSMAPEIQSGIILMCSKDASFRSLKCRTKNFRLYACLLEESRPI